MKKLILVCVLILQPLLVFAGQPLSREVVTSFYAAMDEMDKLQIKYPEEFKHFDTFGSNQKSEIINYIKSSKAYADIRLLIKAKGFSSIEDFFDITDRLMGSLYKVEMQKMSPQQRQQMAMMEKSFDENIKMMKRNGMSDNMNSGMQPDLHDMKKDIADMQQAAKSVSQSDVKFVSENYDWLQTFIASEDDFHGSQPPY